MHNIIITCMIPETCRDLGRFSGMGHAWNLSAYISCMEYACFMNRVLV